MGEIGGYPQYKSLEMDINKYIETTPKTLKINVLGGWTNHEITTNPDL